MVNHRILLAISAAIVISVAPVRAQVIFSESFEGSVSGWTLTGDWAIGGATAGGGCPVASHPDPALDATGTIGGGVAGTTLGGNTTALAATITSPVFDASCRTSVVLEFARHLNSDYLPFVRNRIEVWNGSSWVIVWESSTTAIADADWTIVRYDVSAHSNAEMRIRIGYEALVVGYVACSGWNIDNVRVFTPGAFLETFDDNSAGWTLDQNWQIGAATAYTPTGGSCGFGDPAFDGSYDFAGGIAGVVIGGPVPTMISPPFYLTSPMIDTSGLHQALLSFSRFLNSDYPSFMINYVDVYDGSNWVNIWQTQPGPMITDDVDWGTVLFDVTAWKGPNFRFRIGTEVGSAGVYGDCGGFNIDNVIVYDGAFEPGPIRGQAPVPGAAVFDINSAGACAFGGLPVSRGQAGPYFTRVSVSSDILVMTFSGAPIQPIVLAVGNLAVAANPIQPYGQLDIGTAGFGGIAVVASGTSFGLLNSLFFTNALGQQAIVAFPPPTFAGVTATFQCVFFHPSLVIQASNAVNVEFVM